MALFGPIEGHHRPTWSSLLDVLRLAAAPPASVAHHLPSIPHCSVCNHDLARAVAVSLCSYAPQRSTPCSFLRHVDDPCPFSQSF